MFFDGVSPFGPCPFGCCLVCRQGAVVAVPVGDVVGEGGEVAFAEPVAVSGRLEESLAVAAGVEVGAGWSPPSVESMQESVWSYEMLCEAVKCSGLHLHLADRSRPAVTCG